MVNKCKALDYPHSNQTGKSVDQYQVKYAIKKKMEIN